MTRQKIGQGDWIVVCDGRKALILKNVGDEKFPNLQTAEVHEHSDEATRTVGTDAPGRVFASVGTARSSVEQTDWHADAEKKFLQALSQRLEKAVMRGETKGLTIVAPPRALGVLRQAYTAQIKGVLRGEIDKDLVGVAIPDIEKRLFARETT
jgi:protein required for attachment to host cells